LALPKPDDTASRQVFHEETQKTSFIPGHLLLLKGKNVLAAEVHQVHVDSSDLLFDFELTAVINKKVDDTVLPPQTGGEQQTNNNNNNNDNCNNNGAATPAGTAGSGASGTAGADANMTAMVPADTLAC
jgi:hypothetical protein